MSKTFTLHLSINNLASKSNEQLINIDTIFDLKNEFEDVYRYLNHKEFDVRQEVVDRILEMGSKLPG